MRESVAVDKILFDEFTIINGTLSDDEIMSLTRPLFQAPTISTYLARHTRIREVANNGWIQTYKPQLLIELRLLHLTNIAEAAMKPILNIIEVYIRNSLSTPSRKPSAKLGGVVNFLIDKAPALSTFPNLQSALAGLGKFHELRNAASHGRYMFDIKTKPLSEPELLAQMAAASDTPEKKAILESLLQANKGAREKLLALPVTMGKLMGLSAEMQTDTVVDGNLSKIGYENGAADEWVPINVNTPSMSFTELTKLLNDMDKIVTAGLSAIVAEVDVRLEAKKIEEAHCSQCKFPNWRLVSAIHFDCWYCFAVN